LVDRDVDLRLRVDKDGVDLVAGDPAALVEVVHRRLGAELRRLGAAAGERAGDVVDEADLDLFLLRERRHRGGERSRRENACHRHGETLLAAESTEYVAS